MAINDFSAFEVGTVFNPIEPKIGHTKPVRESVSLRYPSRLGAMTLDASKIANNNNMVFPAGQIAFSVGAYKNVTARITETGEVTTTERTKRASIVRHAGMIVRQVIEFDVGVEIDIDNPLDLRHSGLGSSGSTLAGAAAAVNELFGNPIEPLELARYCAHNYGEEIDDDDLRLVPVQSIGGSAMCGLLDGGLVVVSGNAVPIYQHRMPEDHDVVVGIPKDYSPLDAEELIRAEVDNMDGFQTSGDKYAPEIAYRMLHKVLPGLAMNDLKPCKDLIFDYRWDMGSIQNCSFVYPRMVDIAESLRDLKDDDRAAVIAPSSVGPAFFSVTKDPEYIAERFDNLGMETHRLNIHNGRYEVYEPSEEK